MRDCHHQHRPRSGPFLESQSEWKDGLAVRHSTAMARNDVPDLDVCHVSLGHVQMEFNLLNICKMVS